MKIDKYTWTCRKFWKSWFKQDMQRLFYKFFYGWKLDLLPRTGKGKFVSVYQKGKIIQIVEVKENRNHLVEYEFDEVRIIPVQYNHGVMVERWRKGRMYDRHLLSLDQFQKDIIFTTNVEQLTNRK